MKKLLSAFSLLLISVFAISQNTVAKPQQQKPVPIVTYDSEEVEYNNADKTVHYGATLTKPRNAKNFATVIIISGSEQQDRDGTLMGHKFYWVLADYLTKQGIAVLRVDDRGVGKSTIGPDPKLLTSKSFSYDVEASFNYLLSRPDIDKKKIGLIGHSEGGIIAPMVAARRKDIGFIILWAGPIIGGLQTNLEQNVYNLKKAGIDSNSVNAFKELHKAVLSIFSSTSMEALDESVNTIFTAWKAKQTKETLAALYVTDHSIVGQNINTIYHSLFDLEWMRFFISYDPASDLAKVSCPVLAINGTKDTQVDAKENLSLIRTTLTKSANKNFQVTALPALNHFLQTAQTGDVAEYATIEESISPLALSLMAGWIKDQMSNGQ